MTWALLQDINLRQNMLIENGNVHWMSIDHNAQVQICPSVRDLLRDFVA